ncbi:MAG: D-aspartate ligase [Actinomycetia bacterium]|nr:D-aspartate ligase [Actinomycetes bacterium]
MGDFDKTTPAVIFKIGCYRLHHGGLALIRSLGRVGIPVYGVHEDRLAPAALSAHLIGGFIWPTTSTSADGASLLAGFASIASRLGRPAVAIATDDHGAAFLNNHAAELAPILLLPACPSGLARDLTNKATCAALSEKAGLAPLPGIVVRCPVSARELSGIRLPVVVKRTERTLLATGKRTFSTRIAHTAAQLAEILGDESGGPFEVILQEVIPGDDWLYHGYYAANSVALVSFTGRKLRSRPAHSGETAHAQAIANPELKELVEGFLKQIGYVGPVSMDLRHDARTGSYRLLDVNPRVGACFRVFQNIHGIDVARAQHLDLTGRAVPSGPQVDGRTYTVENYDLGVRRTYARSSWDWLRGLRGSSERAWLDGADLLPPVAAAAQMLLREPRPGLREAYPKFFPGLSLFGKAK